MGDFTKGQPGLIGFYTSPALVFRKKSIARYAYCAWLFAAEIFYGMKIAFGLLLFCVMVNFGLVQISEILNL